MWFLPYRNVFRGCRKANSVNPDQTAALSDLGLHCLPRSVCLKTKDHYGVQYFFCLFLFCFPLPPLFIHLTLVLVISPPLFHRKHLVQNLWKSFLSWNLHAYYGVSVLLLVNVAWCQKWRSTGPSDIGCNWYFLFVCLYTTTVKFLKIWTPENLL